MEFTHPPAGAAWLHQDSRQGFEVAFFRVTDDGLRIDGHAAVEEDGDAFAVEYEIELDPDWRTRTARVRGRSPSGSRTVVLETDGSGHWAVDGKRAPYLEGCLDVDLEASALTNALPVRRLSLPQGARASAPAAWVRARDLTVERLEQTYTRSTDRGTHTCHDYAASAYGFSSRIVSDESGLPLEYPGIAVRAL
ncbi:putative glycolipid-binding domain-containing protein [Streptomyces tirandamycinicus]|uniref:putative glycolipid-binding domain-containing protein n=1 Tax=Streptomyces tirandamycinicus TaxID=2174846 RepID=UPI00226D43A2|nr:putative glycolipid-binding domain-containing protein [Streptomyces tirandamycinicus]MCY0981021.1 putative glycolipid-binding domain-containing protein [Streptomyces tirandamycinicus]